MTNILLAAMVAAFVLAFAVEVLRRKRREKRSWLSRLADEVRRGFMEGYRGKAPGESQPAATA
jgi:hypothetical protein